MVSVATMKSAIRAEVAELRRTGRLLGEPPPPADPPPGAVLDKEPFAKNWWTFLSAIREDGPARRRIANAWTERVGSEGGFLVPWSLTQDVFAYLSSAVIWPRASVLEMGEYRLGLPLLDAASQASGAQGLGGITFSIIEPGAPIPASNPQFGAAFLEAHKLAALVSPVPDELADDAQAAFSDLFSRIVGMGLAWELDDLFYNGSGAGEPEGILNAAGALAVTRTNSGSAPVHADVTAMLKKLHVASKERATWLASEDVFDAMVDQYLTVGTAPSGQDVAPPGALKFNSASGEWELFGMPFKASDHQPPAGTAGDLVLCDLSLYQIGSREMLTVERSSMGSGFASGASAYRLRARVDGRFLPQSTYTLANGKVVSPLVVLS
jgi:HK97 family phage major capsid protein